MLASANYARVPGLVCVRDSCPDPTPTHTGYRGERIPEDCAWAYILLKLFSASSVQVPILDAVG